MYAKTRVSLDKSSPSREALTLIDTGNLAKAGIVSERFYDSLHPTSTLRKTSYQLFGAAKDSELCVIGRVREQMSIVFSSAEKDGQKVEYQCRPFVVRNLETDLLLSNRDLINMGVWVHPKSKTMFCPLPGDKYLKVPLTEPPEQPRCVKTVADETIRPGEHAIFPAEVPRMEVGQAVTVDPDLWSVDRAGNLVAYPSVDKVRPDNLVHFVVTNLGNHPLTIAKDTVIGYAMKTSPETPKPAPEGDVVAATRSRDQARKAGPIAPRERGPTRWTRKQVGDRVWTDLKFDTEATGLTRDQRVAMTKLLARHRPALCLDPDECGDVTGVSLRIDTGDSEPIRQRCRPLAPHLKQPLKEQLDKWIAQGVITPSSGPWANPIVAVPKKNGSYRFCADYRALNAVTKRDSRPVANLEEQLARIKGSPDKPVKYFATLDLSEAYHSVPIEEESQEKTSLITPLGLYKFTKMSFGLAAAPAAFHAVVQLIEKKCKEIDPEAAERILLYFDDCLITATTFEELQKSVEVFIQAIEAVGMKLNLAKCQIGARSVIWLGHRITETGVYPDQDRVAAMKNIPNPKTYSEVARLHGAMSALRKFVRNFAHRTRHIRALLKKKPNQPKNEPIHWTAECQQEKDDILSVLTSDPVLGHPNFADDAEPFIVTVDTSRHGIGCTLSQRQQFVDQDGVQRDEEVIIFYGSRRLTDGESRYSAYKLELVGMVNATETLRYYLIGRPFKIRTDHRALQWLQKTNDSRTPALCFRWQSLLSEFKYTIEWVPGSKMKLVDALSRRTYADGEAGNMRPILPKRDKFWDDDLEASVARSSADDDVWTSLMHRKFGEPKKPKPRETPSGAAGTGCVFMMATRSQTARNRVMFRKLTPNAIVPTKQSQDAAGFDLASPYVYTVPAHGRTVIATDLAIQVPEGTYGRIAPRSSLALKHLDVAAGVLDRDYTGNVQIVLVNNGSQDYQVLKGQRVAQLILEKIEEDVELTECEELPSTSRGAGGFGSTNQEADVASHPPAPDEPRESVEALPTPVTTSGNPNVPHKAPSWSDVVDEEKLRQELAFGVPDPQFLAKHAQTLGHDTEGHFETWIEREQNYDEVCDIMLRHHWIHDPSRLDKALRWKELCEELNASCDRTVRWLNEKQMENKARPTRRRTEEDLQAMSEERAGKQRRILKKLLSLHDQDLLQQDGVLTMGPRLYVIPLDCQDAVIQAIHTAPGTFHLGQRRTAMVAKQWMYYPGMDNHIRRFVGNCDSCLRGKRLTNRLHPGLGKTSSIPQERLRVWSCDLIHMPPGRNGYKFIMTMIDVSTAWPEAYPLRTANARNVIRILQEHLIPRYGEGLVITTDRGPEMKAKTLQQAIEVAGCHWYPTTSHHSSSQVCERFHRVLEEIIRCKLLEEDWPKEDWPQCLPEALYTMRCSPDSDTGKSAFERTFGKVPVTRCNKWFGQPRRHNEHVDQEINPWQPEEEDYDEPEVLSEDDHCVTIQMTDDQGAATVKKYHKVYPKDPKQPPHLTAYVAHVEEAQDQKDQARQRRHQKNKDLVKVKHPQFFSPVEGELVDWFAPHDPDSKTSKKLATRWQGPYRVIDKPAHNFTVYIGAVDRDTLDRLSDKPIRVYVGDLRPSTIIKVRQQLNWKPPWLNPTTREGPPTWFSDSSITDLDLCRATTDHPGRNMRRCKNTDATSADLVSSETESEADNKGSMSQAASLHALDEWDASETANDWKVT